MACSNTPGSCLPWFLSAGWERTKSGIPSRWFQLKSNQVVIICLSDAHWQFQKELTCPHEVIEWTATKLTATNDSHRRSSFLSKIWNSTHSERGMWRRDKTMMWWRDLVVVETMQGVQYLATMRGVQCWRSTDLPLIGRWAEVGRMRDEAQEDRKRRQRSREFSLFWNWILIY